MDATEARDSGRGSAIADIAARLERLPTTSYQRKLFLIIATAWLFDSVDLGALTFLLSSIRAEFGLSLAGAGLLSSASFLGMFVGAAASGMAADRFGRKAVFQTSMVFWGLGSVICGFAPDVTTLAAARVLVGFGMGMEFPVAQAIASEITPATHRGRYIALLEGCWPLGFILAGFIAYLVLPIGGWRTVFILEGLPSLWLIVIRRRLPESPRWLVDRGRKEEAFDVMADMERRVEMALDGVSLPPPRHFEVAPPSKVWGASFRQIWSGKYARRTTMLWLLWFFALLGFYGLTTWLGALLQQSGYSATKSTLYAVLISLGGIPGFLFAAVAIERWGRKPTCMLMLIGGAVFCYLYGTAPTLTLLIVFGLIMQFFLFGMWSTLYAYTPELYPTRARATGTGFASAIGRVGSLIGPPLVGIILPWEGQAAVFGFGAMAFIIAALAVFLLGEEPRGQIIEVFSN